MSAHPMTDKQELRRRFSAWRKAQPPETLAAMSEALCRQVTAFLDDAAVGWVLGYAPLAGEPDIRPLLECALATGRRVALPRCSTETHTMQFYGIRSWDDLRPGSYGIAEPSADCPLWEPTADAVCLVPALSFDRDGYRLGYGGGYYDRFLPTFAGVSLGLCPSACLVEKLPHEPTDQPVTRIITEGGISRDRER